MKIGDYVYLKNRLLAQEKNGDCFYTLEIGTVGKIIGLENMWIDVVIKATSIPEVKRRFFLPTKDVICLNDVFISGTFGMLIKDDSIVSPVVILNSKVIGSEDHKYSITDFNPITFAHNTEDLQLFLFHGFNDYKQVKKAWNFIKKNYKMVREWEKFTDVNSDVIIFKVTPKNSRKFLKFFKVYIQYLPESSLFSPSVCQIFRLAFENKIDLSCSIVNHGDSYLVTF